MERPSIIYHQPRGQCIIMLMAALNDVGVSMSRQETIEHIGNQRWFALQKEDWKPYQSQKTSGEARWKTLMAWARKDAALRLYVNDHERNSWSLSRSGHQRWEAITEKFSTGAWDVTKCYLWSPVFKHRLKLDYSPSERDAPRPLSLYRDCLEVPPLEIQF